MYENSPNITFNKTFSVQLNFTVTIYRQFKQKKYQNVNLIMNGTLNLIKYRNNEAIASYF